MTSLTNVGSRTLDTPSSSVEKLPPWWGGIPFLSLDLDYDIFLPAPAIVSAILPVTFLSPTGG